MESGQCLHHLSSSGKAALSSSVTVPTCPVPVTPVPSTQEYVLTSLKHYLGNLLCSTFISGETAHDSLPFQVPRLKPEGRQLTWKLTACPSSGQSLKFPVGRDHPTPSPPIFYRCHSVFLLLVCAGGGPGQGIHSMMKLLILVSSTAVSKPVLCLS